jgi:Phage integrase family
MHDLRRTFVSHLAMAGVSAAVVQKLAGHASIATTVKHYTQIMPEALREAQSRLPFGEAISGVSYRDRGPKTGESAERPNIIKLYPETG